MPLNDVGGLLAKGGEGGGELGGGAVGFDVDGAAVAAAGELGEPGAEVVAGDAGERAFIFFGEFDETDPRHRAGEIGGGVAHDGHVKQIGEDADVGMVHGGHDCHHFFDTVEIVAFRGALLLDGDGDAVAGGERGQGAEERDELFVGAGARPAVGDLAGGVAAEADEVSAGFGESAESDFGEREHGGVIGVGFRCNGGAGDGESCCNRGRGAGRDGRSRVVRRTRLRCDRA